MIKRTLYFSNPVYLKTKDEQLVFNLPNAQGLDNLSQLNTIPIEDIGIVILDNQQITISHGLVAKLLANNIALITCDHTHHPTGLMLNLDGHSLQSARFQAQVEASVPLKKQLWQQTVRAKIENQAAHLHKRHIEKGNLERWATDVKSGDSDNHEAMAAVYYWKNIFSTLQILESFKLSGSFVRDREGFPPNNLLNYGYAILRATVARNLVGSGLLPTLGIFHKNQYNAYCLADDIMEPYRPFVDNLVYDLLAEGINPEILSTEIKKRLLQIPTLDVNMEGERCVLMNAVSRTTASLSKCFEGSLKKIIYPKFQ
jgi:CRISP-associated protein Cas1